MKSDKTTNHAWDSYERQCADCDYQFKAPDIDALLLGEMYCGSCGQVYDVDDEDRNFILAFVLAKLEQLDRRSNPFAGIDL